MEADEIKKLNIEFSNNELEENTILFIENYFCGARGIVSQIFYKYLQNPLYKYYKLVWLAQDYDETVKDFGAWLESERVWLCVKNGYDYVRYLNTAKYIYTAEYLPSFYQKRKGQMIFYAPADITMAQKVYTKAMLWRFVPTINQADHIIVEKNTPGLGRFVEKHGQKKLLKGFETNDNKEMILPPKTVFFSITNTKKACKSLNIFKYLYNFFTQLADAYGYSIHWRIPLSLYKRFSKDEYAYDTYKNVHSSEEGCLSIMSNSDLIVADNLCDLISGFKYCDNAILFASDESAENELEIAGDYCETDDAGILANIFEMILGSMKASQGEISDVGEIKKKALPDCPPELKGSNDYRMINKDSIDFKWSGKKTVAHKKNVLIMAEVCGFTDMAKELDTRIRKYTEKVDISILYRGTWKGLLYERLSDISTDIPYICRSGALQCSDAVSAMLTDKRVAREEKSEIRNQFQEAIQEEWIRILGRNDYDYAICITGKNVFWLNMYDYIPAKESVLYEKQNSAAETVDLIEKFLNKYIKKNV